MIYDAWQFPMSLSVGWSCPRCGQWFAYRTAHWCADRTFSTPTCPAPDPRDQRIADLERRVAELEQALRAASPTGAPEGGAR